MRITSLQFARHSEACEHVHYCSTSRCVAVWLCYEPKHEGLEDRGVKFLCACCCGLEAEHHRRLEDAIAHTHKSPEAVTEALKRIRARQPLTKAAARDQVAVDRFQAQAVRDKPAMVVDQLRAARLQGLRK